MRWVAGYTHRWIRGDEESERFVLIVESRWWYVSVYYKILAIFLNVEV